jgi:hypothetical protein
MQVAVWDSQAYADVANSRFQSLEGSAQANSDVQVQSRVTSDVQRKETDQRPHS